MSSSLDFVEYVTQQLRYAGNIRYRRMFGEFGLYCDDLYFAVICDNRFLIKVSDAGKQFLKEPVYEEPYAGGKPMFLIDNLEDTQFLKELTQLTCDSLSKSKKKKNV